MNTMQMGNTALIVEFLHTDFAAIAHPKSTSMDQVMVADIAV
jgi:hypothetical protein